ncbi:MAG: peptidylprolyl isomerase [Pseudomonadota bacterium]
MLDFIRRGVKSIFAQILLALLIVSFAVWGIGDVFGSGSAATIATVGNTKVDADRFADVLIRQQRLQSQRARQLVSFADLRAGGVDQQVLSSLVRDATYAEELSTLGIAVPGGAIADAIAANDAFRDQAGNFSPFAYQSVIAQQGYSPVQYERLMGALLGQQILADAVSQGVGTIPGLSAAIARFDGERRRVAAIRLPAADAPDPAEPTEDELTAYLEANPEAFRIPERRSGQMLLISPVKLAIGLEPTDEEIAASYNENPDAFAAPASRTVEQVVFTDQAAADDAAARLVSGEVSFADIAAEQNLGEQEISLGRLSEGELAPAADAAVFAATAPGVVGPVDGPFGPILLNITDVRLGGTPPLEEVADQIRLTMSQERARRAALDKIERIDDMRASGEPLDAIATATELPLTSFTGLARDGSVTEGETPFLAADPRFWAEVNQAELGEERDIAEMSDGSYIVAMIGRIDDSRIPELDEAREQVVEAWTAAERLAAQEQRAQELIGGAGGGTDLQSIAVSVLQGISERAPFTRGEPPQDFAPELTAAIFDAPQGGMVSGPNAAGDAVLIVQIRGVIPIDDELLAQQVEELDVALGGAVGRDQLEYYARALEQRHGSGINTGAVDGVFERLSQTGHGGM